MYASGITYTGVSSVSPAAGTLTGADNGLSVSGANAVLGQDVGQSGNPGALISNREIPMGGNSLSLGNAADTQNFSFILVNDEFTIFQDVNQDLTGFQIFPPNNIAPAGSGNLELAMCVVDQELNYTNAGAVTGVVGDYRSFSSWTPSASGISFNGFDCAVQASPSGGSGDIISFGSGATVNASGGTGTLRGFLHAPNIVALSTLGHIAIENRSGDNWFNSANSAGAGRSGFRLKGIAPTAFLHIGGSDGAAGHAPLKLTSGTLLAIVETGSVEYSTGGLFFTPAATRLQILAGNDGAAAPVTSAAVLLTNFYGTGGTNYLSTPNSWVSTVINGTTYKIPLYT